MKLVILNRPVLRFHTLLAFSVLCVLNACSPAANEVATFERIDSAGVTIALSRDQLWPDSTPGLLSAEPTVEIGVEIGEDAYLLSGVAGAAQLPDGSIVVCNTADRTLRFYTSSGEYQRSVGGEGRGPGELRNIIRCLRRNGQIWVYQAPAFPIERFDDSGQRLEPVDMPRPNERFSVLVDISEQGELVVRQDARRQEIPSGVSILPATLFRTDPDGSLMELGTFDGGRWVRSERVWFPAAYSPTLQVATMGETTLVGWPETFDIGVLSPNGSVDMRIRRESVLVPATDAHRRALVRRVLEGPMPTGDTPYDAPEVRRQIVDMMIYPDVLPAHYRILVTTDGRIWIERGDAPRDPLPWVADPYEAPTTWDVFGPEGAWLGPVELPGGFDPLEIGERYVLGVHRDQLGVERVRMYELTQPRMDG
jgi:hypothetical protein